MKQGSPAAKSVPRQTYPRVSTKAATGSHARAPPKFNPANSRTDIKFRYLPESTNRNQMILKEIFSGEQKFAHNWQRRMQQSFYGEPRQVSRSHEAAQPAFFNRSYNDMRAPQPSRGFMYSSMQPRPIPDDASSTSSRLDPVRIQASIQDNLKQLGGPRAGPRNPFYSSAAFGSPIKFAKTYVKTSSFDPINGEDKVYNTPPAVIRSLGTNGDDIYYTPSNVPGYNTSFYR